MDEDVFAMPDVQQPFLLNLPFSPSMPIESREFVKMYGEK